MLDSKDLTRFVQHNDPCSMDDSHTIKTLQLYSETALEEVKQKQTQLQELMEAAEETKNKLIQTISHCCTALSPHRNLPDEILRLIFSMLSMNHGPVLFPLSKNKSVPPQLIVSHVCRKWRRVAQSMGELWNNINILNANEARSRQLGQRWLLRAGGRPVTLEINLTSVFDTENIFLDLVLGIHVEKLSIRLTWNQFSELKDIPAKASSTFKDVRLSLEEYPEGDLHELPRFAQNISGICAGLTTLELDVLSLVKFPWSQIRYLKDAHFNSPVTAFRVLQQAPLLEELCFSIYDDDGDDENVPLQTLTLHRLRILTLELAFANRNLLDRVLEHLQCPNIVELDVVLEDSGPNTETYQLLKQGYNLCRLEVFDIRSSFLGVLPVSAILKDAPMLRHLSLPWGIIWDDEAFTGLSTGTLGRALLSISLTYSELNFDEILQMISIRQKNAQLINKNTHSWKEGITPLKAVQFREVYASDTIKERVRMLEGLGLKVVFHGDITRFKLEREYNIP